MYKNISDAMLLPNLIKVRDNLIIAKFELMKILPAKHIVEVALSKQLINPEVPIIETSSGTFALGLGIVCAEKEIPFFILGDPAIDQSLERQLTQLGGKVQILSDAFKNNKPQEVRLNALHEYLKANPAAYWTRQYDNLENQNSYSNFADYLVSEIGANFTLVGAVGSGGSTCGTMKKIRKNNIQAKLVGVDTFGSILFGLPNQARTLRGLGNSLMPKNLEHRYFDEIHWVGANDAFAHARQLYSKKALFCGPTTGATFQVASWIANKSPNELVVFIAADTGYRYKNTIYYDEWIKKNCLPSLVSCEPIKVSHPREVGLNWSYFEWNRRSYEEIIQTNL